MGRHVMVWVWVWVLLILLNHDLAHGGNVVFQVKHKYGKTAPLGVLRSHDSRRHGRMLAGLDFHLGGDGSPTNAAKEGISCHFYCSTSSELYYTKITIGTPPVDYHVQVDTGSDILWVNCKACNGCPTKSDLDIPLNRYDLKASSTGKTITCDNDFCATVFTTPNPNCKIGMNCEYNVTYGDGSITAGYFVRDNFRLDQVTGDLQTTSMNGSVAFGCSDKQYGDLGSSSQAVDGIIGFGQANTSILSQLALSGKVKRVFSHCLDGKNGGGIFAIGDVVDPKVSRTSLVPNQVHYNVDMKAVEVGDKRMDLGSFFGFGPHRRAIIDSGTTLAYVASDIYDHILVKIMEMQADLKFHLLEGQFQCFWYSGNVDDGFPVVNFVFKDSLSLAVYPHNYLFEVRDTEYCIGWQNSTMQTSDGQQLTILGDIALSDKLVLYDMENQTIGWAEYNCSSNIKVVDEASGRAYDVGSHDISVAASPLRATLISLILFIPILLIISFNHHSFLLL